MTSNNVAEALRDIVRAEVKAVLPALVAEISSGDSEEFVDTQTAARLTGLSVQFFECGRSLRGGRPRNPNTPPHYKVGSRVLYRNANFSTG